MLRHLYLVRHAEAAAKESRQEDQARELTPTGMKDALHLGARLREQNIHFDAMVSSSALRAEQTTGLIVESMKLENARLLVEDALYEAPVRHLLAYINDLEDGYYNVLITGHNPSLSYLAEYLTKADIGDMSPGSVAVIKFSTGSWKEVSEGTGVLVGYEAPPFSQ